ncbi:hypothetical protein NDU88_000445 [Pleurodeles waltl]|uniref:Uncharacterized protein n=1 Tax=Pleurodeles waltl TaxID=8319 RepID=A0AAV7P400_PLEWA|nr:hypothetical protein NDU88_000445 [Pleurodeles waltl]
MDRGTASHGSRSAARSGPPARQAAASHHSLPGAATCRGPSSASRIVPRDRPGVGDQITGKVQFISVASYRKLPQATSPFRVPLPVWGLSPCPQELRHRIAEEKIAEKNNLLDIVHVNQSSQHRMLFCDFVADVVNLFTLIGSTER